MKLSVSVYDSTGALIGGELAKPENGKRKKQKTNKPLWSRSDLDDLIGRLVGKGKTHDEGPGHPFHGNQYVEVAGQHVSVPTTGSVREKLHNLFAQGHKFTLKELAALLGQSEVTLRGRLSEIKNAAPAGGLIFEKNGDHYSIKKKDAETGPTEPPAPPAKPVKTEAEIAAEAEAEKARVASAEQAAKVEKDRLAKQNLDNARANAIELSTTAKTEAEHYAAANAHELAATSAREYFGGHSTLADYHASKATAHRNAAVVASMRARDANTVKPKPVRTATAKEIESRFAKSSVADIQKTMLDKHGLHFLNGRSDKKLKALIKERSASWHSKTTNPNYEWDRIDKLIAAERAAVWEAPGAMIRSHSSVDIDDGSSSAKGQRKLMGHVDNALDQLSASGFDVKAALSAARVAVASGSVGKSLGHAFQIGGVGHMAFSPKGIDPKTIEEYARLAETRKLQGKPVWTVGVHDDDGGIRSTVVHELAHALGMQAHINSPAKLLSTLNKLQAENKLKGPGSGTGAVSAWVRENISQYAATNIKETDAELAAKVTSPSYVRGSLPKELEDHVDALFHRRPYVAPPSDDMDTHNPSTEEFEKLDGEEDEALLATGLWDDVASDEDQPPPPPKNKHVHIHVHLNEGEKE